jgi:hypothetical protein
MKFYYIELRKKKGRIRIIYAFKLDADGNIDNTAHLFYAGKVNVTFDIDNNIKDVRMAPKTETNAHSRVPGWSFCHELYPETDLTASNLIEHLKIFEDATELTEETANLVKESIENFEKQVSYIL